MENPASRESVVVGCCLMIGTSDRGPAPIENPFRSRLHKFGVKPRREITRPTVKSQRRHTIIKYFGKQTRPLCHCAVTDTVAMDDVCLATATLQILSSMELSTACFRF